MDLGVTDTVRFVHPADMECRGVFQSSVEMKGAWEMQIKTKRLLVYMRPEEHRAIRVAAAMKELSMSEYFLTAALERMGRDEQERKETELDHETERRLS